MIGFNFATLQVPGKRKNLQNNDNLQIWGIGLDKTLAPSHSNRLQNLYVPAGLNISFLISF